MGRKEKREKQEQIGNDADNLCKVINKKFPKLWETIDQMADPRDTRYTVYNQKELIAPLIMKNLTGLKSMNEMTERFNDNNIIGNIVRMTKSKHDEIPHFVTCNNYLENLEPECLEDVRYQMVNRLIRGKTYDDSRLYKHWMVIIDATRLHRFKDQNDEYCLHSTYNKGTDKEFTDWYHNVLEAKIVMRDMVFSLATEFIENSSEDEERQKKMNAEQIKQDCEIKAFKRLAAKLHDLFPRLPICILADGLYVGEPVFEICEKYGWDYIIRFKDGCMSSVADEFEALKDRDPGNKKILTVTEAKGTLTIKKTFKWVNEIETDKKRKLNVLELVEEITDKSSGKTEVKTFKWVTSREIKQQNAVALARNGRKRWKIENQGFNTQKNHNGYITHVNSRNYTAMKNHYLIHQIADIIRQLYTYQNYVKKEIEMSIKNISSRLLIAFGRPFAVVEDILSEEQDEPQPDPVPL